MRRLVDVRPEERRALTWSFLAFFCLLTGYYVLRPIRDDRGIAAGAARLPMLYAWTFGSMLALVTTWSALVARLRRALVVPLVYQVFVVNLLVFFVLFRMQVAAMLAAQVFFVWVSVFNFFAVAVFWGLMADVFSHEQGKRLFGFIGAGGSAGAIAGLLVTRLFVYRIGAANLVLISALLLEGCALCVLRLVKLRRAQDEHTDDPVGGGVLTGIKVVFASPYLLLIAGYTLMGSLAGTYGYNLQAHLVQAAHMSQPARIAFFTNLELIVSVSALVLQSLVMGRVLTRLGAGKPLALVPPLSSAAFAVLAAFPLLNVAAGLQALRRILAYGVVGPANAVLFTVVDREQKYKSRAFIETVVFRGGDALTSQLLAGLMGLGLGVRGCALAAIPMGLVWLVLAIALGRMHQRRAQNVR